VNILARRVGEKAVIPAGSNLQDPRSRNFFWHNKRVFPSYLQAGPSFFIEKIKRKMIAEDITAAMKPLMSCPI